MEAVQQSSNVIKDSLDVRTAFGILRSSRRGATAHVRNMKIDKVIIEAVHRWRREVFSMGVGLRLDLIDVHCIGSFAAYHFGILSRLVTGHFCRYHPQNCSSVLDEGCLR